MSEINSSEANNDFTKAQRGLDYNALADAFEAQGNSTEATRFRDLAKRQPELKKRSREERSAYLDTMQQEEKRNQPDIKPLQAHERADASENKGLREQVEKMLQVKINR